MFPVFLYTIASYFPILAKISVLFEDASTALTVFRMVKEFPSLPYPDFLVRMFKKKLTPEEVELELVSDWIMLTSSTTSPQVLVKKIQLPTTLPLSDM